MNVLQRLEELWNKCTNSDGADEIFFPSNSLMDLELIRGVYSIKCERYPSKSYLSLNLYHYSKEDRGVYYQDKVKKECIANILTKGSALSEDSFLDCLNYLSEEEFEEVVTLLEGYLEVLSERYTTYVEEGRAKTLKIEKLRAILNKEKPDE